MLDPAEGGLAAAARQMLVASVAPKKPKKAPVKEKPFFNPNVKLDPSQVIDMRPQTKVEPSPQPGLAPTTPPNNIDDQVQDIFDRMGIGPSNANLFAADPMLGNSMWNQGQEPMQEAYQAQSQEGLDAILQHLIQQLMSKKQQMLGPQTHNGMNAGYDQRTGGMF